MKRVFFLVMLLVCYAGRSWGVVYDTVLKKQLDSIIAEDQRYRPFIALQPGRVMDSLVKAIGIPSDQINDHYARLQDKIDSTNLALVKAIFAKVGYPGSSLVGAPANEVCFYVIQHSAKIDQ